MSPSLRFFILIGLVSLLPACASYGNPSVKDETLTSQIRLGVTTKEEVKALLGSPTNVISTTVDGRTQEIWNYTHATASTHPLLYVPVFGLFAMASDDAIKSESQGLTLFFSENGIVQSITRGTYQSNLGFNSHVQSQTETKMNTSGQSLGQSISLDALQKVKINVSTQEEVQEILGNPMTKTTSQSTEGTQELWTYFQTTINTGAGTSKGASHIITFNDQGVVIGVTTTTF